MATVDFADEDGNLPDIQHRQNLKTNLTQGRLMPNLNKNNMKSTNLIGRRHANNVLMKNSSVSPHKTNYTMTKPNARVTQKTISTNLTISENKYNRYFNAEQGRP
jgi:hypothetical protein